LANLLKIFRKEEKLSLLQLKALKILISLTLMRYLLRRALNSLKPKRRRSLISISVILIKVPLLQMNSARLKPLLTLKRWISVWKRRLLLHKKRSVPLTK
jgi:Ser/Thr protein kinase RdoA (MazF antagonist)